MPVFRLDERIAFPPVGGAVDGLLAIGGDLAPERLLLAYSLGIFPWYEHGQPILWHSPDPRMVLAAEDLHVSRSLRQTLRRATYHFTLDTAFRSVMEACASVRRPGQRGTWITPEMLEAYAELHRRGYAHSVEAWRDGRLTGGLYGVSLGGAFFGESMFARERDASKAAFATLVGQMRRWDITLIDCQVYTDHLARFGAALWPRRVYLRALKQALARSTRMGPWALASPAEGAA